MNWNKIIGYILIIVGLLLIVLPLWQTYNIFTGNAIPAEVFKKPASLDVDLNVSTFDVQGQMQNALIKILPIDFINNTLNLMTWMILLWVLIYGGGKLADVGIKMIRN